VISHLFADFHRKVKTELKTEWAVALQINLEIIFTKKTDMKIITQFKIPGFTKVG
jgi:hypothetical protein